MSEQLARARAEDWVRRAGQFRLARLAVGAARSGRLQAEGPEVSTDRTGSPDFWVAGLNRYARIAIQAEGPSHGALGQR